MTTKKGKTNNNIIMTDQELKKLTDSELLEIIDLDISNSTFKQISKLAKNDGEFRSRIYKLRDDNIKSTSELITSLEENIKTVSDGFKPHLQKTLDYVKDKLDKMN